MLASGSSYSKSARGSVAPIVILAFGRSAFSKSDWAAWIRVTVEPSTVVGLRRPRLVFWS
jgi:hypothetical protein